MTSDEIRAIPAPTLQTKLQVEVTAQVAELKDAILDLLTALNRKASAPVKHESTPTEDQPKKVERVPLTK